MGCSSSTQSESNNKNQNNINQSNQPRKSNKNESKEVRPKKVKGLSGKGNSSTKITYDKELEDILKDLLNKEFPDKLDGPGCALVVLQDGEPIYKVFAGAEDLSDNKPINSKTRFDLASVSKHFTGASTLSLIQDKIINEDTLLEEYMPELKNYNDGNNNRKITVYDVAHMASGFHSELDYDTEVATNEDALNLIAKAKPAFPTGTKYIYSNNDYMMLALLTKRVVKKPFSEFMEEKFFKLLGMNDTKVMDSGVNFEWAQGYKGKAGDWIPVRDATPYLYGDGNVYTTIDDLCKWEKSLHDNTILTKESLNIGFAPVNSTMEVRITMDMDGNLLMILKTINNLVFGIMDHGKELPQCMEGTLMVLVISCLLILILMKL